jgi:hypothetical protein
VPDDQLWTELDVSGPLGTDTTITGVTQLRLSESLANPIFTAAGLDLDHKSGEWTLGIGYRHQVTGNRQGEDTNITQVLRLNTTWRHRFGRNTLAVRTRVENLLTASGNPWRVRVRPEYRWATPDWGMVSYLYTNDEVFYDFSKDEFYRNRFQAGMNLAFGKRTALLVYYQRRVTASSRRPERLTRWDSKWKSHSTSAACCWRPPLCLSRLRCCVLVQCTACSAQYCAYGHANRLRGEAEQ